MQGLGSVTSNGIIGCSSTSPSCRQVQNMLSAIFPLSVASSIANSLCHFIASGKRSTSFQAAGGLQVVFQASHRFSAWANSSRSCLFVTTPPSVRG